LDNGVAFFLIPQEFIKQGKVLESIVDRRRMQLDSETGLDAFYRLKRKHFPQVAFHTSVSIVTANFILRISFKFFCPIGVLQVGDLVEISGLTKCGKSQFLYQCTANYVLNQLQSEYFRRELQLVWIDMDWNFDVSRLRVLLQSSDRYATLSILAFHRS